MKTILSCLCGLWLSLMITIGWAAERVPDPGQKGPYAVGFASATITDPSRGIYFGRPWSDRPIPVYVWFPVDPADVAGAARALYPMDPLGDLVPAKSSEEFEKYGLDAAYGDVPVSSKKPFPLVIFSPGWGSPAWQSVSTATRLASHGFVVAVLYHAGDGFWPWEPTANLRNGAWQRPRDISFALDMLLMVNDWSDHLLGGAIRPDQVAAGGYSLGGYAAMVLGGAGEDGTCTWWGGVNSGQPFCSPNYPDPRIKAIVYFDGAALLLDWAELAQVRVPTIMIGEEWNMLPMADEHARTHAAIQGKPSYRVDVSGTNHNSFCDTCETLSLIHDDRELSQLMWWVDDELIDFVCVGDEWTSIPSNIAMPIANKYAVAFLKTVLAKEQGYQDMLTPGWALKPGSLVEFFVTEKRNPNAVKEEPGSGAYYLYFPHQPGSEQARGMKDPLAKPLLQRAFTPH
jgi:predicted dienelactone hydrolase